MSTVPNITLNNGVTIPQLGFGTYQIEPDDTVRAVRDALEIGYRHIDTAQMYGNEAQVAEAVRQSGVDRDEVFLTSKLNNGFHDPDDGLAAFDASLDRMGIDQLDLFLIHWPLPQIGDFVDTWQAMETIAGSGRVRAIGVSNFNVEHLQRLFDAGLTVPAVNQFEAHPYLAQDGLRRFGAEHRIVTEAWAPIAQGKVLGDPVIEQISERLERSAAQVTLRWHIQRGDVVFPKTTHRERMAENFALFDFELDDEDMAAISGLDRDGRLGPKPEDFNWIPDQ